jgi:hypothetical protein
MNLFHKLMTGVLGCTLVAGTFVAGAAGAGAAPTAGPVATGPTAEQGATFDKFADLVHAKLNSISLHQFNPTISDVAAQRSAAGRRTAGYARHIRRPGRGRGALR